MKKPLSSRYFKLGLTALIVVIISTVFKYNLSNRDVLQKFISNSMDVLMPIIYGLIIAYLIWPIVNFIEKKCIVISYKKNNKQISKKDFVRIRAISLIVSLIIVFFMLYAFFGSVVPEVYNSIENIITNFPVYYDNVIKFIDGFLSKQNFLLANSIDEVLNSYSEVIRDFTQTTILPTARSVVEKLYSGVFSVINTVFDLIIGLIIAIYLILSKEKYMGQCKKMIYSMFEKTKANNLMTDFRFINETFGGFLVGKIVDSIIIGILCFIVTSILDMPYALLVSVIVGVTNIIPFFGPFIGAIPSALLILLVNPKKCLVFLIFVFILQQLDGNVIGPAILGNSIGMSSFWIIVSITVFGGYFGFIGMLLGVPVFAILYAFLRRQINRMLIKKKLDTKTGMYINLDYIDSDNNYVMIREGEADRNGEYYKELNPSNDNNKSTEGFISKFLKKISNKKSK